MEELIKISKDENGKDAVSARELYRFLISESDQNKVGEKFTDWIKRALSYGFEKGVDYEAVAVFIPASNGIGGTNKTDYVLTIECAKQISMIQRNDKGIQARKYFIECEKIALNPYANISKLDALKLAVEAEEKNLLLQEELKKKDEILSKAVPKADYADRLTASTSTFTATSLAKELGMSAVKMNKLLHAHGFQYRNSDHWVLYEKHTGKGYEHYKVHERDGKTFRQMEFTELGRAKVHSLIRPFEKNEPSQLEIIYGGNKAIG